ncbi:hypothetical protein IFM89_000728 [Coptis chinensis]|uniref:F-box associated beta-propeller type 1 domain-containing protein n=1 Tax=Coptis chinensis TaxID=261450 RepID=A0A835ITA9_9MAGN|nr:hypothetical protein IFM89_000728 [Coptis chinensis]
MKLLVDEKFTRFASCAGLVCCPAKGDKSIYICNPVLGDYVEIPCENDCGYTFVGFGYAPLSKKSKYVQFSCDPQPGTTPKIFTLGDKSWRVLVHVPFWFDFLQSPVYCNGVLYWVTYFYEDESQHHVFSFDLKTEKFRLRRPVCLKGTGYKLIRETGGRPGVVKHIMGKTFLSYHAENRIHTAIRLPFAKDLDADGNSLQLVFTHVGSLVSPSKIV